MLIPSPHNSCLYQKWSSTKVGIEIFDSQWGESAHALKGPRFLFWGGWGWGREREGGGSLLFPMCSLATFPIGSHCLNPQHVPSCTSLCPICFAKTLYSWKFGTYIGKQILRLISFVNIFILTNVQCFKTFLWWANQRSMNLDGPPTN